MNEVGIVTALLKRVGTGDSRARSELMDLVYVELRSAARRYMNAERHQHTLQPTALVNEAYLRLFKHERDIQNRVHFFALASQIMRAVLVDHARAHRAAKRGDGQSKLSLHANHAFAFSGPEQILSLNDALEKLEEVNARCARVVDMRFFGGLKDSEIADVLDVTPRTVARDWAFAKAFLHSQLAEPS